MAEFDPRLFIFENPYLSTDILYQANLTKSNLFSLATLVGCNNISSAMRKADLIQSIINKSNTECSSETKRDDQSPSNTSIEHLKLKIELCKAQTELEKIKSNNTRTSETHIDSHNNIDKYFKYVPQYDEKNVDIFFTSFEHIANLHNIDEAIWAALVQSKFKGKAAQVTNQLNVIDSRNYQIVKDTVMRAFALVPLAYQYQFRKLSKGNSQSWSDYIWEKESICNKWFMAKDELSVEDCKQIIIIEDIVNKMPSTLSKYISEREPKTLYDLGKMADEFCLSQQFHNNAIDTNNKGGLYNRHVPVDGARANTMIQENKVSDSYRSEIECWNCGGGHTARHCNKPYNR